jgi:hypothetical protein
MDVAEQRRAEMGEAASSIGLLRHDTFQQAPIDPFSRSQIQSQDQSQTQSQAEEQPLESEELWRPYYIDSENNER